MKISPNPEHSTERKPNDSAFRQSTMKAYKPVPTVKSAAIIFTILGIIFIIVGSVLLAYSKEIIEHSQRYDNQNECANTSWNYSTTCQVSFYLDKKMNPPIYFYYQLNNFYQNHRRYVKSKSADQLQGSILTKDSVSSDCDPIVSMQDLGRTANQLSSSNLKAHAGDSNFVANPCGLIAQTLFNDTYQIQSSNGTAIFIDETNIAWPSDKEKKFKRAANWQDIQWTDVENEHFIVWMRTSGLPNFRKLWGHIDEALDVGTYTVTINSYYDISSFSGKKFVVISTANALGGDNTFLGIAYIVVGGITLILALAFVVRGYFFRKSDQIHSS